MISVALCTHNGERFLSAQLESILNQTLLPDEIVLSDDASTDDTVAIAEAIAATHPGVRLRVLRNARPLGVTKNFEQAVLATEGELIVLSDQDDLWYPNRIEKAAAEFARRPGLLLLHGDARLVDADGEPLGSDLFAALEATPWELGSIVAGRAIDVFLRRNLALGAATMFRRSLLEPAAPFDAGWVHDEWLAVIAAATGEGTVDFVPEPLIDYRQHGANQIGVRKLSFRGKLRRLMQPRRERNRRLLAAFEHLAARLEQLGVAPEIVAAAREKVEHERVRNALPAARILRVVPVMREVRTGRYRTKGRGAPDVLRDLVQPVG
jgi:glycosyltransferase involved in cell wall biosynthesis